MPFPNSPSERMLNEAQVCVLDNSMMLNKIPKKPQETLEVFKPMTPV